MAILSRHVHVFLNGEDISNMVRSLEISAEVTEAVTATLVLYPHITWDADGNIHLTSGPSLGPLNESPVPGLRVRGINLTGDGL